MRWARGSRLPGYIFNEHFQEGQLGDFQLSRMNASLARAGYTTGLGCRTMSVPRPTSGGGFRKERYARPMGR
jgi:hypothetical protein